MDSVSEIRNPIVDHPKLSTLFKGVRHSISTSEQDVWQFRGIKYGNVSARFQQSALNEAFAAPIYDATTYGPKCPQPQFPLRLEDELIGLPPGVVSHPEDVFDEFNCLNLNVTTPAGASATSNLPVLIYIHGGGGFSGSNGDWWCDGGSIVKRSMEIGKPVISVVINYRLSILGYIGSEELGSAYGKENIGNQALRDAHTAIKWIHKHIAPFGGSPSKLTIYGESHGSVLVDFLLRANPSLPIDGAITQSGQTATILSRPKSLIQHDDLYTGLKKHLNITTLSELQGIPYADLLAAYTKVDPGAGIRPSMLLDGYFLTEGWKDFSFEGRLLIGNTGSEECVLQSVCSWYPRSSPPPALTTLATTLSSVLPASSINSIFTAYGISDKIEKGELVDKLLKFIADIAFCKPAHDHASEWRKRGNEVYQFLFEQKQPFTGIYKGKAAHSLDLAYLHGNPAIFLNAKDPEGERKIQKAFQDSWIGFAHGEKSWGKEVVRRFGPGEVVDENLETVNGEWFRRKEWKSWEGLSAEQVEPLAWLVTAFVGGLIGFESH